ncbi:MAG: NHLP family bacteriocin export ABC transporter peptidase/permease/ATPase subunit [Ruminococcus sp.]|nr:NHLP family bacteriocin export ABC transporter peptidase/permease/ATPase subunit [Ruminococcus sp.]MCM1381281.1 NHLP family bacteriocin export ABC transporter peptidase/permease/ATPase subunit [Muribaculaceae bacterium]MCM1478504.1 NHLP family bacteriocin export ABC transporter peptidase/permease/ATPase subunit [Muribaculaceae bacterium]
MKRKVKKVPVILQMEALECGAASLAMVLAYYKKFVPLEQLRSDCNVSRDGSTAKYISLAAKHHGLETKGYRMSIEKLKEQTEFPMIIHWNFNHFAVLCGFRGNKAVLNDPAGGRITVDMEEFDRSYTGIALKFKPSKSFVPSGKPKSVWTFVKNRLVGCGAPLTFILTMGFILSVISLVKPVFYKIFTDDILIGGANGKMGYLVLAMAAALVVGFIAEGLRGIYLARLQAKMSIGSSAAFMWHTLRLPVEFFSQRFAGDIASRQQSNNAIANSLCTSLAPVILDVIMIGIYLAVMLFYNVPMTLIGIAMAVINILIMRTVSKRNTNAAKSIQRDSGKLSGIMIAAVSMIETIKASGSETGFFEKISGYQTKYNNAMLDLRKRNTMMGILPEILSGLSSGAVLMLGIYHIFNGGFTIGMLMAFQSFMNLFLAPVGSLVNSIQVFQDMSGNMERVEDVMNYKTDAELDFADSGAEYEKLSGEVELKNISFGYSSLAPALIENFSLKAKKGSMTALVGGSGSGKSTLAKMISGLYPQRSGEILFDGKPLKEIDRYVFTGSVAVVDQSISLFGGTVRDNIAMWDETIPEEVIIEACRDACIHDDIMALKDGYDSVIAEGGGNFSGGQRQRLEIARAFAARPSVIILDEATSALDPTTEKKVMDAAKRREMTCFVIAHRLSTIRDADEIIMLEYGKEVERGTHKELIEKNGKYAALVKSE